MKRILLSAALLSVSSGLAEAQTVGLQVSQLDGPGGTRTAREDIAFGLNALDCAGDATISVIPTGGASSIPSGINQVDLWVGSGDCAPAASRNINTATCFNAGTATITSTTGTFEVLLSALDAAKSSICESTAQQGTDHTVYALMTNESNFTGDITDYGTFTIKVDVVAPTAPTIGDANTMLSGDSQVTVRWDTIDDQRVTYDVVDGGACGSGSPNLDDVIATSGLNVENVDVNPETDLGLLDGESAAVYVVARDQAGNQGEASVEICIERMPVTGFCDVFTEMGGSDCDESGCAVEAPGAKSGGPWLAVLMAGLFWRRRR